MMPAIRGDATPALTARTSRHSRSLRPPTARTASRRRSSDRVARSTALPAGTVTTRWSPRRSTRPPLFSSPSRVVSADAAIASAASSAATSRPSSIASAGTGSRSARRSQSAAAAISPAAISAPATARRRTRSRPLLAAILAGAVDQGIGGLGRDAVVLAEPAAEVDQLAAIRAEREDLVAGAHGGAPAGRAGRLHGQSLLAFESVVRALLYQIRAA